MQRTVSFADIGIQSKTKNLSGENVRLIVAQYFSLWNRALRLVLTREASAKDDALVVSTIGRQKKARTQPKKKNPQHTKKHTKETKNTTTL